MLRITKELVRTVRPYKYSSLRRLVEPRRFHAFCVGTNKSGTHSLESLLSKHYNASHEEDHSRLINALIDREEGKITADDFRETLLTYQKYAWLEMDSSHVHAEYIDELVNLFPEAKFILTIRDCYSWLDSHFNQTLNHTLLDCWHRLHRWRYGKYGTTYSPEEQPIKEAGFYPIENYFKAWTYHNNRILDNVPDERLLVLRTTEISTRLEQIAAFLDIPVSTLDGERTHSFKAPKKHYLLSEVEPEFVRLQAQKHCEGLMTRFFGDRDYCSLVSGRPQKRYKDSQ